MTTLNHARVSPILPRWWRRLAIVLSAIVLCSCRGPAGQRPKMAAAPHPHGGVVASDAAAGAMLAHAPQAPFALEAQPGLVPPPPGPWAPLPAPYPEPRDEYVRDGGDQWPRASIDHDWQVNGLRPEDTIVHYDTVDGRVEIEPSNQVHLYAPRFAAVRQVANLEEYEKRDHLSAAAAGLRPGDRVLSALPRAATQPEQPLANLRMDQLVAMRVEDRHAEASRGDYLVEAFQYFEVYEDFAIIRWGREDQTERARLSERIDAAVTWTSDQAMQVLVKGFKAQEVEGDRRAAVIMEIAELPVDSRVRVVKVASTPEAKPGDEVEFTIRFDNVGNRPVGNVTVLDSLSPRLEFVPGSEQSTLAGRFFAEPNVAGSLVLRWEIDDPVEPGEGGAVRFKCRVR